MATLTEISILKTIVARSPGAFIALDESIPEKPTSRDGFKLALKIWSAIGKFVRSQVNKGRIVDTLYYGTFSLKSAVKRTEVPDQPYNSDEAPLNDGYLYCPGPKSIFKLIENAENVDDLP